MLRSYDVLQVHDGMVVVVLTGVEARSPTATVVVLTKELHAHTSWPESSDSADRA